MHISCDDCKKKNFYHEIQATVLGNNLRSRQEDMAYRIFCLPNSTRQKKYTSNTKLSRRFLTSFESYFLENPFKDAL